QQTFARVNTARAKFQGTTGADAAKAQALDAIRDKFIVTPEGVRYGKPGITEHVQYLAGMTANTDQKVGRDAIERYNELKRELDALKAEIDKVIGAGHEDQALGERH